MSAAEQEQSQMKNELDALVLNAKPLTYSKENTKPLAKLSKLVTSDGLRRFGRFVTPTKLRSFVDFYAIPIFSQAGSSLEEIRRLREQDNISCASFLYSSPWRRSRQSPSPLLSKNLAFPWNSALR